jgi:hypothetical protein
VITKLLTMALFVGMMACSVEAADCNANGINDVAEIANGSRRDCNTNSVPDECDIADGNAADCDSNGTIDDCDVSVAIASQWGVPPGGGECSDLGCGGSVLDDFVLSRTEIIGDVRILGFFATGTAPANADFGLAFYSSATYMDTIPSPTGGLTTFHSYHLPDAPVLSLPDPAVHIAPLGVYFGSLWVYEVTLHLPTPLELDPGAYWLEVYETRSSAPFYWSTAATLGLHGRPGSSSHSTGSTSYGLGTSNYVYKLLFKTDCDANGLRDACSISAGDVSDCLGGEGNSVPDDCEYDCDSNGIVDTCELSLGLAFDCNGNGIPDACDLHWGHSLDCNSNGVPDSCDLAGAPETDCNHNGVPDGCEITSGAAEDCNADGTLDECVVPVAAADEIVDAPAICPEITYRGTFDGTSDGIVWYSWTPERYPGLLAFQLNDSLPWKADAVQLYCVENPLYPGLCTGGTSENPARFFAEPETVILEPPPFNTALCATYQPPPMVTYLIRISSPVGAMGDYTFRIVDETGFPQNAGCASGARPSAPYADCNSNGRPDECDDFVDCNSNGHNDGCDIAAGTSDDCDFDNILDECEIGAGSMDYNSDGIPDECQILAGPVIDPASGHTYYVLADMVWTASEALAVRFGGHLATINDAAENTFVSGSFPGDGLWIGLTDQSSEGTFAWISGQPVTFVHWASGEPNNAGGMEDYTELSGGYWNDLFYFRSRRGLMELEFPDCDGNFSNDGLVGCDCNTNGILDIVDVSGGASRDCNTNEMPDECEFATEDCDGDGTLDACQGELAAFAGYAVQFDGDNDFLNVGSLGDFGSQVASSTVELWVRTTALAPTFASLLKVIDTPSQSVYSVEVNRQLDATCGPTSTPGSTLFYIRDGDNRVFARYITTSIYDGAWHHVAWRLVNASTNTMLVFVDGVEQALLGSCDQSPTTFSNWNQLLTVGAGNNRGNVESYFNGDLDELRIWNVARTPAELAANRYRGLAGDEPGLVAYWQLDESAGTLVADLVGGNNGTLTNGPSWLATQADCNDNGRPDSCDIDLGSADCSQDGVPDECQLFSAMPWDLDHDGDTDLADYAWFADCLAGPCVPPCESPLGDCCAGADFDNDGDLDLHDASVFQEAY